MKEVRFTLPISVVEQINVRVKGGITEIENESDTGGFSEVYLPTEFVHTISSKIREASDQAQSALESEPRGSELLFQEHEQLGSKLRSLSGAVQNPLRSEDITNNEQLIMENLISNQEQFDGLINDLVRLKIEVYQYFNNKLQTR